MKRFSISIMAICMSAASQSQAVCIPTNEFRKVFLGFNPDASKFAIGHSDRVINWQTADIEKSPEWIYKNRICTYSSADSKDQGSCQEVSPAGDELAKVQTAIRSEFKKRFQNWSLGSVSTSEKRNLLALLDCEKASKTNPNCDFSYRKLRDDRVYDLVIQKTHALSATAEVSPLLLKANDFFFSRDKKNACASFNGVAHMSANCGSREDVVICGSTVAPVLE